MHQQAQEPRGKRGRNCGARAAGACLAEARAQRDLLLADAQEACGHDQFAGFAAHPRTIDMNNLSNGGGPCGDNDAVTHAYRFAKGQCEKLAALRHARTHRLAGRELDNGVGGKHKFDGFRRNGPRLGRRRWGLFGDHPGRHLECERKRKGDPLAADDH